MSKTVYSNPYYKSFWLTAKFWTLPYMFEKSLSKNIISSFINEIKTVVIYNSTGTISYKFENRREMTEYLNRKEIEELETYLQNIGWRSTTTEFNLSD